MPPPGTARFSQHLLNLDSDDKILNTFSKEHHNDKFAQSAKKKYLTHSKNGTRVFYKK